MKNRQFIVMMVCFVICGYYFLDSKLTESINRDDFERNLGCASLTAEYEKHLKESDYTENGYAVYTHDVNVFYSKKIKDCVVSYETTHYEPGGIRYNLYFIKNFFSEKPLFSCNNTEDNTGLTDKDCYSKREDGKLALKPGYNTESFYIEQ